MEIAKMRSFRIKKILKIKLGILSLQLGNVHEFMSL
jgi:hypothetical protein